MFNKEKLLNFIPQYYLGGKVEHVIWVCSDNNISVDFVNDSKTLVGKINVLDIDIEEGKYGVFNTSQLIKMLGILDNEILIEIIKQNNVAHKFKFSDQTTDILFSLADQSVISKAPEVKIDEYDIYCNLEKDFFIKFIRSKDSLTESSLVTFDTKKVVGSDTLFITLGNNNIGSNRISLTMDAKINQNVPSPIPFNSENIKEILKTNKDSDEAVLSLNNKGLLKFHFKKENTTSTYYISREN
jgi:hypothetical protein